MTAVHVLHLDHTAAWSGGEIALARLLGALDRTAVTSTVACAENGPLLDAVAASGHRAIALALADRVRGRSRADLHRLGTVATLPALLAHATRVARLARSLQVDVIHTNSMKAHVYGLLAGRMAGIPVVAHLHDDVLDLPSRTAARLVAGWLRHGPRHVLGCSRYVLQTARISPSRSQVVYSGVPLQDVTTGRVQPLGPPTVGLVARIAPWKGHELFLDAAARIARSYPDVRFRIIGAPLFGEHDFLRRLEHLASRPPLRGRVEFRGFVLDPRVEVDRLAVAVATSVRPEPFGMTVVEAMARGVPVVAPAEGGPTEVVTPGHDGVLVAPRDPEALARAVTDLLDDPEQAIHLGLRGLDTVRERFTVEANAPGFTAAVQAVAA